MLTDSELDNPIWSSLRSRHRHLARGGETALGFSSVYAPFVGVRDDGVDASELSSIVADEATVFLLGIAPRISNRDWHWNRFVRLRK